MSERCCEKCAYWYPGKPCKAPAIFPDSAFATSPGMRRVMNPEDGYECKMFTPDTDYWWCPKCQEYVPGIEITVDGIHEECGGTAI